MATLLALYVGAGLLLIGLSVPLIRHKVRPNGWYGFRVRQTPADPEVWYAANAYAGKHLLGVGVVTVLTAVGLYRVPGINPGRVGSVRHPMFPLLGEAHAGVRHHTMKHAPVKGIQPPQMPKQLAEQEIRSLADHAEYAALRLAKCDFTGQTAADVLFEQVEISRTVFQRTDLTGARLFDARVASSDFSGADWRGVRFRRVELSGCRLLGVQLVEAYLDDVIFRDCNLESAVFASAAFKAARFEGCVLRGTLFEGSDLRGVVFTRCDLTNADLQGANLRGADLRGSLLDGLRVNPKDVQGAIIDPSQAVQVVGLLGLTVKSIDEA